MGDRTSAPSLDESHQRIQGTAHLGTIDSSSNNQRSCSTSPTNNIYLHPIPNTAYSSPNLNSRNTPNSQRKYSLISLQSSGLSDFSSIQEKDTRRKVPKDRMNTVKRSVSTPNVQAAAMSVGSNGIQFSSDKRRNKLGYHRTSVACGHCRRRKIRCLLPKEDSQGHNQGRCSNCIRLKKECTFSPVETTDRRPRSHSKPDISSNETKSSTPSPSPGLALGKLPHKQAYAASVPVTPTYDLHHQGVLEDSLRHNSVSSTTSGRLSVSHSATASRRPSLVHTTSSVNKESDYIASHGVDSSHCPRIPNFRMNSVSEPCQSQTDQRSVDSAFWRLTSSYPYSLYSQHIGSMSSLHSMPTSDSAEDSIWPSRMNSVDHGLLQTNCFVEVDYNSGPPELYNSTGTSTTSLAPPNSEVSPFPDSEVASQLFMPSWMGPLSVGTAFDGVGVLKSEPYGGYYSTGGKYQEVIEENPSILPSPLQSPKFISQM